MPAACRYNFSAGPATLPAVVLQQAQQELTDWKGLGLSVMEISHRSAAFMEMAQQAESDLRTLLGIPDHYRVLFLQGGAHSQFAMVPLNLLGDKTGVDYVDSGDWSLKAIEEARQYAAVNLVASSRQKQYLSLPPAASWQCNKRAAYLHYTPNETIRGVEFHHIPETQPGIPLVADMSSTLLSRPIDIERFGLIYAGAQKNIGPAGLTLVIVRDDLLGKAQPDTPTMMNYQVHAQQHSLYNTPPTYAWYLAGLVFQWIRAQGGLTVMAERNAEKARYLYDFIDGSGFYHCSVEPACRSWMNVVFKLADPALESAFLQEAEAQGLYFLKGHRKVGGMRASLYNAMPLEGVQALVTFMQAFMKRHG